MKKIFIKFGTIDLEYAEIKNSNKNQQLQNNNKLAKLKCIKSYIRNLILNLIKFEKSQLSS